MWKTIKRTSRYVCLCVLLLTNVFIAQSATTEISDLRPIPVYDIEYNTRTIERGDLIRTASFQGELVFPNSVPVMIPKNSRLLDAKFSGEYVEAGDVIAEFEVDANPMLVLEAELNYELARARLDSDIAAGNEAIRNAFSELDARSARASLEFTRYTGNLAVERALDALDAALFAAEDYQLLAPVSGYIGSISFVSGGNYTAGHIYCVINDPYDAHIRINSDTSSNSLERLAMYKYSASVTLRQVRGESLEYSGNVISNTVLLGATVRVQPYAIIAFDDIDAFVQNASSNRNVIANTQYDVRIEISDISDVLLCPRRAIQRENVYRYVYLLEDGMLKKRYIQIGLASGDHYQVLDGLNEGDIIVLT